ncbi:hypothetical protein C5B42_03185 [Candidatus Cerribacteria bacterium 'Amazon FNV 2010 28 9']|uniref:Uncharacterized protein n=1 Tax=Candidatus Cerribacteria bacterium 'Amazon FNV 2010 28 9' TaxID=2081795 RepID=A0A317JPR9_9BACT|nr:MAG: hypothetical protein C5B42_03185 [Candidatus Cerribacteria bacterium 'Amazon FNV 2010 28 9']
MQKVIHISSKRKTFLSKKELVAQKETASLHALAGSISLLPQLERVNLDQLIKQAKRSFYEFPKKR